MKKRILLLQGILLIAITSFAQLNINPNNLTAKCPGDFLAYTVEYPIAGLPACTYHWEVTNGEIQGGSMINGKSVISGFTVVNIKWNNTTSGGTVKVSADCNPSTFNVSKTWSFPILSINNVAPPAINGLSSFPLNITTNRTYNITEMSYPNVGTNDPNPYAVTSYDWEIPAGWTVVGNTDRKEITVTPDNCTEGTIRVRGKSIGCPGGPYYSAWSTPKTITRTLANPGDIAGAPSVTCSDLTPQFYSIPAVTGATSYAWTIPSGWSGQSTTNSITVTPDGVHGGTISVKALGCNKQSQVSSMNITINSTNSSSPPKITGEHTVCFSGSKAYSITNMPPNSTISWTQSPNLTYVSGQGTTSYSVKASTSTVKGAGWVEAVITTPCGPVTVHGEVWVGEPDIYRMNSNGTRNYMGGGFTYPVDFATHSVAIYSDAYDVSYGWEMYPEDIQWIGIYNEATYYASFPGNYVLTATADNECGTHMMFFTIRITDEIEGFSVYPNPAENTVTIERSARQITTDSDLSRSLEQEVISGYEIYHADQLVSKGTLSEIVNIDVSTFLQGNYIIKIITGGKEEVHHVIIK